MMAKLLIVYGSVEGHTHRIAGRIGDRIRAAGHDATVIGAENAESLLLEEGEYHGVIVCAPVHGGRHPETVAAFVRDNLQWLSRLPSAFVSVSLAAALETVEGRVEARSYAAEMLSETGWKPGEVLLVAGALRYTQYDFFKRLVVRLLAERRGGATDTSRDWDYTDWPALDRFADAFVTRAVEVPLVTR